MQNTRFYGLLISLVVLAGTLCLSPAISSLMNSVIIRSSGYILATEVWASSGSPEDIQAAVDAVAAAGGGNVYVPEGNFVFNPNDAPSSRGVQIPGGVNVFGGGKEKTILRATRLVDGTVAMFYVDGSNGLPSRISGFTFIGYVDEEEEHLITGVRMYNCKNFRVDHCKFIDFNHYGISTSVFTTADKWENGEYQYHWNWGLIDHCDFDNPYKEQPGSWQWSYLIGVGAPGRRDAWLHDLDDILGRWDIDTNPIRCALYDMDMYTLIDPYGGKFFRWLVYIEDCTFKKGRYAVASNTGAYYVFRHNDVTVSSAYGSFGKAGLDVHEGAYGEYYGGRGLEAYGNVLNEQNPADHGHQGFKLRGGSGVVFNNTINNLDIGVWLLKGVGDDFKHYVHDLYIWSNTYNNVGSSLTQDSFYQENTHYFLYARPNYTPYPYPHPLTSEAAP